ncbi:MAG: hypothetical protein ACI4TI_01445 [Christensenellales bacterium]
MTQERAKKLLKIGKYFVIALLAMFFVIIIIQSVKINNLSNQKNSLQAEFETKLNEENSLNQEINTIESDKDKYWEEELRKDNYKKNNETIVVAK